MRKNHTYRGARKRLFTQDGRHWRDLNAWANANMVASLPDRAAQCAGARLAVAEARREAQDQHKALIAFWADQKQTRVVRRILKDLRSPRQ